MYVCVGHALEFCGVSSWPLDQSHENGMKFRTLEIEEQVRGPFKVCRTRAATCEVTMSIADILISQLHTLQETKKLGRA